MDQLTEARWIVGELAAIFDKLSRSDRRFVESWTAYLARTGTGAEIGPYRLANLRKTHRRYFPEAADSALASLAVPASARADIGRAGKIDSEAFVA